MAILESLERASNYGKEVLDKFSKATLPSQEQPEAQPDKLDLVEANAQKLLDSGSSIEEVQDYLKFEGTSVEEISAPRLTQGKPVSKFTPLVDRLMPETEAEKKGKMVAEALAERDITNQKAHLWREEWGKVSQKVTENVQALLDKGASLQEVSDYVKFEREGIKTPDVSVKDVARSKGFEPPSEVLDLPAGLAGGAVRGATAGLTDFIYQDKTPESAYGEIGQALGELGGAIVGLPGKAMSKVSPKALEPVMGEGRIARAVKSVVKGAVTLPVFESVANAGRIFTNPMGAEILKESIYGGAFTGAEFGALQLIDPFKGKLNNTILRVAGKLAIDAGVKGEHPFDERELKDKAFGYAMDIYFLSHGKGLWSHAKERSAFIKDMEDANLENIQRDLVRIGNKQASEILGTDKVNPNMLPSVQKKHLEFLGSLPENQKIFEDYKNGIITTEEFRNKFYKSAKESADVFKGAIAESGTLKGAEELKKRLDVQSKEAPRINAVKESLIGETDKTISVNRPEKDNLTTLEEAKKSEMAETSQVKLLYSGFHPTQWKAATDAWEAKADKIWSWASGKMPKSVKGFFDPFSFKGGDAYKIERAVAFGKQIVEEKRLKDLIDNIASMPPKAREMSWKYLLGKVQPETENAKGIIAPAIEARKLMQDIGKFYVEKGMLDADVYETNKDTYLPKMYLKYLVEDAISLQKGGAKSDLGNLLKRKDLMDSYRQDILGELGAEDMEVIVGSAIGKGTRNIIVSEFMQNVAKDPNLTYAGGAKDWPMYSKVIGATPEKPLMWTAPAMKAEIEAMKKRQAKSLDTERAKRMGEIIADGEKVLESFETPKDAQWKQIPDSKGYGELKGLWVRKEIADDLRINIEPETVGKFWKALETTQGAWKALKVPFNLPSQARNLMSNMIAMDLSGMPLHQIALNAPKAISEIKNESGYYKELMKYGVQKSTFTNQELKNVEEVFKSTERGAIGTLTHFIQNGKTIAHKPIEWYQGVEVINKLIRYRYAREVEGMTPDKAYLTAQKALFDYSLVHPSVHAIRRSPVGAPFLTYNYKVLPLLAETAVKRPWKLAKYALIATALKEMAEKTYGDISDEEMKKLKYALPDFITKSNAMLLPYKTKDGKWMFVDMGNLMPWGGWTSIATDAANLEIGDMRRETGLFGGPLPSVAYAISANRDMFTGRQIVDWETDSNSEATSKMINYAWSMAMPSMLTEYGLAGKLTELYDNGLDHEGKPINPVSVYPRFIGWNTYLVGEGDADKKQYWNRKKVQDAFTKRIYSIANKKNIPLVERREAIQEKRELMREKIGEVNEMER